MESINVLITGTIDDEYLQQITDVSTRIKLTDVSDLMQAERSGDTTSREKLDALLSEAEVIFGLMLPQNIISRAPQLRWIQAPSAGVNRFLYDDMLASSVILTNTSGIHAVPIGEFVIGLMLMFVKQMPLCFQLKQQKDWRRLTPSVLHSKTVGIVGLGNIGREVARLAKAFGMRVLATRRSAKRAGQTRYVDTVLPPEQLAQLLTESDFVVLAVPLTHETDRLIGEKELRTMKSTAFLINIARGGVVDEQALIRALDEHWIAGAGLDVFATEPLPKTSRLWDFPNVIFSPHISGDMGNYVKQATDVFVKNLRRYVNGEKLLNVVDKKKGY